MRRIYEFEVTGYEGTSPAPAPLYSVRVHTEQGPKLFSKVRPAQWSWDALGVDEDAAKTVLDPTTQRPTTGYATVEGDVWKFHFTPAPLVGDCP